MYLPTITLLNGDCRCHHPIVQRLERALQLHEPSKDMMTV